MGNDGQRLDKKIQKFSVVQKCPGCGQLSLSFMEGKIACNNCGYEENAPVIK